MFGSLMRPNSGSCKKVNLNTIARQQRGKQQGKSSSIYSTISLDKFNLTNPPRKLSHSRHSNHNNHSNHSNHNNHSNYNNHSNHSNYNNHSNHNPIVECEFKTTNLKTNKVRTLKKKVRLNDIMKVDDKLNVKDNFKVEYKCRSKDGKYQHSFSRMNVKHGSHSNSHRKPVRQKHIKNLKKLSTLYNQSINTSHNNNNNNNNNNSTINVKKIKPIVMINNNNNANSRLFTKKPIKKSAKKGKKKTKSVKKKPSVKKDKGKGTSIGKKGTTPKKKKKGSSKKITKEQLKKLKSIALNNN